MISNTWKYIYIPYPKTNGVIWRYMGNILIFSGVFKSCIAHAARLLTFVSSVRRSHGERMGN